MAEGSKPATWEQLVEFTLSQASTRTSGPSSAVRLLLTLPPQKKHLPRLYRTVAAMAQECQAAIRSLVEGVAPWPLFLHGPAGTGKTCAGLCLADHVEASQFWTLQRLCSHMIEIQQRKITNSAGYEITTEKFWQSIGGVPLFVLDEIGCRDRVSDHVYETLKNVLDERHRRPLVCISNLTLEKIEELFDDRIASRLCEGTVLKLAGKDRRLAQQ